MAAMNSGGRPGAPRAVGGNQLADALTLEISKIEDTELRHLSETVFAIPKILGPFLHLPASRQNHHAFPGGLAMHTLETVGLFEQLAQVGQPMAALDLDIGRVACLLHDLGKALPLGNSADRFAHEHAGREFLAPLFSILAQRRPRHARLLDYLIGGHREERGSSRLLYTVRQADILSACMNNEAIARAEGLRDGDFITLRTNGPERRYIDPIDSREAS